MLDELAEALTETKNLGEVELLNYLKGSSLRTDDGTHPLIELDASRNYSVDLCRAVLTARNVEVRVSAEHKQRMRDAVWNDFVH